jgi:hypothetical protein
MSYSDNMYEQKYLKYKAKYISLKQYAGGLPTVTPAAPADFKGFRSSCMGADKKNACRASLDDKDAAKVKAYTDFITTSNTLRANGKYTPAERKLFDDQMVAMNTVFGTSRNDNLVPFMNQVQLDNYVDAKQVQACFGEKIDDKFKAYCNKK